MIVKKYLRIQTIVAYSYKQTLYFVAIAIFAYLLKNVLGIRAIAIPFVPLGVLGSALAIFLAFRNNTSYNRWWEARTLWGGITSSSRTFGRQVMVTSASDKADRLKKELLYRQIAYVNALRLELRQQQDWQFVKDFLEPDEYEAVLTQGNKANYLLYRQAIRLEQIVADGYIKENRLSSLDTTLRELCDRQSGCERIKQTPMLRQYQYFTRLFLWIFSTLLPFSFIEELGGLAIPFSTLISFIFTVLDLIGSNNENPFENKPQDVPMTAICREIERDLKILLNELDIPPVLHPVNGILM